MSNANEEAVRARYETDDGTEVDWAPDWHCWNYCIDESDEFQVTEYWPLFEQLNAIEYGLTSW